MIEKLVVGRYLKKSTEFDTLLLPINPSLPEHFIEAESCPHHITQSVGSGSPWTRHRTSEIFSNPSTAEHRSFTWLPYVPGKITYIRETGLDILTGKMSGCWIVRFLFNGFLYVAHIGTEDSPDSEKTVQAYATWNKVVSHCGVRIISAFNPTQGLNISQLLSVDRQLAKECYAVIDARGKFYTVVLGVSRRQEWAYGKKICAVYPLPPVPLPQQLTGHGRRYP